MELIIDYLKIFAMSMVPVLELRGALIWAAADGLDPVLSYIVCVIRNTLPVPFLIMFVRPIFEWMKKRTAWMRNLVEKLSGIKTVLYDERLTTVSAHKFLIGSGLDSRKHKNHVDELSAKLILEDYLTARKNGVV